MVNAFSLWNKKGLKFVSVKYRVGMRADSERELKAIETAMTKWNGKNKSSMVEEAFYFAQKAHENQYRKSGEEYFTHPVAVARMLAEKGMDEVVVTPALLHDVLEDTKVKARELKKMFGEEVYSLVEGVTNLDRATFKSRHEKSTANTIKTMMASSKDLRVLVIKLFDKLHNMRTIKYLPKKKQMQIAADALMVYAPLSHRLGMHDYKYELEDLCFKTLEPKKFKEVKAKTSASRKKKLKEIKAAISILKRKFPNSNWKFEEKVKSYYMVHGKSIAKNKDISSLIDTVILKVIVPKGDDCYDALGKIHSVFKPVPGKFKDLIALPEFGIYQSLHTQVIGPKKKPFKIYVLCTSMDEIANDGIIAILRHGKDRKNTLSRYKKTFAMLSKPGIRNNKELAETLDLDAMTQAMIVFTEKGEVLELPPESTAIDFAFFKDPKKARKAWKAEINGKLMPLWTKLISGDRAKIIYSPAPQINTSWLSLAYSQKVKRDIERSLKEFRKPRGGFGLIKFRIDSIDTPGLLGEQCKVMAKNGFNVETAMCKVDGNTGYTEFIAKNTKNSNLQRAAKQLRQLKETLSLNIDYIK